MTATTIVKLGDGTTVTLADWVDHSIMRALHAHLAPSRTGDPTRWPDIASWYSNGRRVWRSAPEICDTAGLRDGDLRAVVAHAFTAYDDLDEHSVPSEVVSEAAWVLANVLDVAVDTQRRRDGLPDRGPRPEPAPIEAFTVGRSRTVPR